MSASGEQRESVTGVQLAQGIGHRPSVGFWAEAWQGVVRRPGAIMGLGWVAIIAFFALFAPLLANGNPLLMWEIAEDGSRGPVSSPLLSSLSAADAVLIAWGVVIPLVLFLPVVRLTRSERLRVLIAGGVQSVIMTVVAGVVHAKFSARDVSDWMRSAEQSPWFVPIVMACIGLLAALPFLWIAIWVYGSKWRSVMVIAVSVGVALLVGLRWSPSLPRYDYLQREATGQIKAVYTLVPYSPTQSATTMFNRSPGSTPVDSLWDKLEARLRLIQDHPAYYSDEELGGMTLNDDIFAELRGVSNSFVAIMPTPINETVDGYEDMYEAGELKTMLDLRGVLQETPAPVHLLGTDTLGQDVLSQMMHACRLSISIGLVSTSIAVVIGVTIGAIMGYFGGIVDLLLYRVVELFMAIPVLFLLIVAAGVLPRNTYIMMAIIGCFTWTSAARYIRAEFFKLRDMDYIQSARAMGLPLRSILFKHMLPNGVTPVLVDASFLIAAAILIEAILSYLGLGPSGQASWGKLLSNATGETGAFIWWLAIFPGGAIFLTTLAYNLIGEALRDAVDPELKKARV